MNEMTWLIVYFSFGSRAKDLINFISWEHFFSSIYKFNHISHHKKAYCSPHLMVVFY